ncbi:uncharacterized protein LOC113279220 [Papaver somniferum]|uniref:uncharacterized protein LOC113279220 n=1 Tax=Papaver somniferum TaxID=3469 RepID=UPI000E6F4DBA|nr:uncharacterized protein LOC113279220 [Papaver somniferum]
MSLTLSWLKFHWLQSAEKAAKFIWPHLKRNNSWQLMVRALDPNIFAIRFYSTEDKEAILFGGAWNLDDYLIVLRDCHPSYPYQQMNFDTSPFWLEFKNLLPEFTYPEILRLFADIVVETIVVEPDGVFLAEWDFFFEKQPYKLCPACRVPNHDSDKCNDRRTRRINTESAIRNLGPAVEQIVLPVRNPEELANLYMQHGHQRRSNLREPVSFESGPLDGMLLSYFTTIDSQSNSYLAPADRALPHQNLYMPISSTASINRTFIRRKRCRNLSNVVVSDDESNQASMSQPRNEDNANVNFEPATSNIAATRHLLNRTITDDGQQMQTMTIFLEFFQQKRSKMLYSRSSHGLLQEMMVFKQGFINIAGLLWVLRSTYSE